MPRRPPETIAGIAAQRLDEVRREVPGSWERLIGEYETLVYAVPARMGLTEEECEEVFQETWVALLQAAEHRIRDPGSLPKWLIRTAERLARRVIRRRIRAKSLDGDDGAEALPDLLPPPPDAVDELERRHAVQRAMEELSPHCRRLLDALYYGPADRSYAEMAAGLGMKPGSMGPTRLRCLARLAGILERRGFGS